MLDVAIVGGGLCGLALAHGLGAQGRSFALFEARDRLGGRIVSVPCGTAGLIADLGPGWLWPATQPRMTALLAELGLPHFPQHDDGEVLHLRNPDKRPEVVGEEPIHGGAHRVVGGMARLVAALADGLGAEAIRPGHVLRTVSDHGDHVALEFDTRSGPVTVAARQVVLALPPRLADEAIRFAPELDADTSDALRGTPTWMASRAKLVVAYDRALWRAAGRSGSAFVSHEQAVLAEVFDASGPEGTPPALGGFLALTPELREAFATGLPLLMGNQLAQLFGPELEDGISQTYQDWATEPFTCARRDLTAPASEHLGTGNPLLRRPHWNGRLLWGGSETAAQEAGYLEGALDAAARLAAALTPQPQEHPAMEQVSLNETSLNETSLAHLRAWVTAQSEAAFDLYRQRLNAALARQDREQLTQRAILGAAEEVFAHGLTFLGSLPFDTRFMPVERGRAGLMPAVQAPFGPFLRTLMDEVIAFNRTSCALSNFPDEHRLSREYSQTILRDLAAAWQEFSLDANRLLLAKAQTGQARAGMAQGMPDTGAVAGAA